MPFLEVRKPIELIAVLIEHLRGSSSRISFQGDLSLFDERGLSGVSRKETPILKPEACIPADDFLIVPLNEESNVKTLSGLLHRIGIRTKVSHVFIEHDGEIVFNAIDNFSPGCVHLKKELGDVLLTDLIKSEIIKGYQYSDDERE